MRELDEVRHVASYAGSEDPTLHLQRTGRSLTRSSPSTSPSTRRATWSTRSRREVRSDELETYVTGAPAVYQDLEEASNEDVKQAEKYAFPFAMVILIFAFGTLVAAGVPVLSGGRAC